MPEDEYLRSPACFVLTSIASTGGVERDAVRAIRMVGEAWREEHAAAGFVRPGVKKKRLRTWLYTGTLSTPLCGHPRYRIAY